MSNETIHYARILVINIKIMSHENYISGRSPSPQEEESPAIGIEENKLPSQSDNKRSLCILQLCMGQTVLLSPAEYCMAQSQHRLSKFLSFNRKVTTICTETVLDELISLTGVRHEQSHSSPSNGGDK